jgi:predicted TPR repeat methyltransferase
MGNVELFDAMAERYDTPERERIAGIVADAIRERAAQGRGGSRDKTAIDFGCGTGLVGLRLLDAFREVIFADASKNMLAQVHSKIERLQAANARVLYCGESATLPSDLKPDYIFLAQALLHVKDYEPLLVSLRDALKDGGHLIIVDFDKNVNVVSDIVRNGFNQADLKRALQRLSFEQVESHTFYSGEKMFMNQDASLFILDAQKSLKQQ